MTLGKLFPFRRKVVAPRLYLMCVPFAGGAAAQFRSWVGALAPSIDVCPVELPGRGVRMGEPPVDDMARLCDGLVAAIRDLTQGAPLALFGHSMGARIAFELARNLDGQAAHLFVAGSPPPEVRPRYPGNDARPTEQLDDLELRQRLRDLGGTPPELLDNDDLMARAMPIVRADLMLIERYRPPIDARVTCPITALSGIDDDGAQPTIAVAWRRRSSAGFRLIELGAGHFFLDSHRAEVLREIDRDLARLA